ncbi:recombinase family protein [Rhodococcus sp. SBT000017]|uniref:recombinase family protein n=1 Tax=Rhodococcus sp. SBT000017 TaxID=1803385 RepID=UPI0037CC44E9
MTPTPPLGIKPLAVHYLRVSTKDQAERGGETEGFSIPAQREACLRKAQSLDAVTVAEFVDAGESARSANRPELKKMLDYVKAHKIQYVIVHKIDRLARNRVDDVEINLQLTSVGAQLVSCSENIDETPSGMLLHGIMSSIAEFYSRNLATESRKGMLQKAKGGGTPGMAPFGFLNIRTRTEDGREVKTVVIDPERGHWVTWMFERYATGEWTAGMIKDEFDKRGVTTVTRPNRPSRPIAHSHITSMLQNRYYTGAVRFEGVEYPGNHPALVSEALFAEVQRVREARHQSREKPRVHNHYLKGSVYCGQCGEPLTFEKTRNRAGNIYDYFYCLGRQRLKNGCTFRAIQAPHLEDLVTAHWQTVTIDEQQASTVRALILDHMRVLLPDAAETRQVATDRLQQLERESRKLLEAFYADAIGTVELRAEQARIAAERAEAEAKLGEFDLQESHLTAKLESCLEILGDAHRHYQLADAKSRRDLNQSIFKHLYVHDDDIVASDLTPAYQLLMNDDLAATLAAERKREQKPIVRTSDLINATEVPDRFDRGAELAGRDLPSRTRRTAPDDRIPGFLTIERPRGAMSWENERTTAPEDRGSNIISLVAGTGFEPATSGL